VLPSFASLLRSFRDLGRNFISIVLIFRRKRSSDRAIRDGSPLSHAASRGIGAAGNRRVANREQR